MPNAIERRLEELEELVHPGARQRAEVATKTAAERAALAAEFNEVARERSKAVAAHQAKARELRTTLVASITANAELRVIEGRMDDLKNAQRDLVAQGLDVIVGTYIPRATLPDFDHLLRGLDGDLTLIAHRRSIG